MLPALFDRRRASALLAALALAGCDVGPRYHRPALDVPVAYTSPPQPPAAPPPLDWWRGFAAPDLNRLIETALHNSPDVQAAAARIVQADQAARVAGSPLLPGITGTLAQNYQRSGVGSTGNSFNLSSLGPQFANLGHSNTYTDTRTYSAELNASYEVDFWGKNRDAFRAAEALATGSRYDAQTVWLTTISSIANTYFQALGYRDRELIAQRNLHDAAQVLDAFRARMAVGTANALDVSQQEALVAGYRATIPSLESQYRQQVIALAILVGEAPERITLGDKRLIELAASGRRGRPAEPRPAPPPGCGLRRSAADFAEPDRQQDFAVFFPSLTLTASGGRLKPGTLHHHRPRHRRRQPGQPADPDHLR